MYGRLEMAVTRARDQPEAAADGLYQAPDGAQPQTTRAILKLRSPLGNYPSDGQYGRVVCSQGFPPVYVRQQDDGAYPKPESRVLVGEIRGVLFAESSRATTRLRVVEVFMLVNSPGELFGTWQPTADHDRKFFGEDDTDTYMEVLVELEAD
jgi:hypothetical protein